MIGDSKQLIRMEYSSNKDGLKFKYVLRRHEFALVAFAFVDILTAISSDAPTVVSHHMFGPSPLIALFHRSEVMMEVLSMFITDSSKVFGQLFLIKVTIQQIEFDTHVAPKIAKSQQHSGNQNLIVMFFLLPRKFCITATKDSHDAFSLSFIFPYKFLITYKCTNLSSLEHTCFDLL